MNSKAWMLGLLLILSVICSASLAIVNIKTGPIIRTNLEVKRMMTVLNVFGVTNDIRDSDSIKKSYDEHITETEEKGLKLFREKESGATALYLSGNGFQGTITVVVALKDDTINGFRIISQNETPGLGARIQEDAFQNQFIGKKVSNGITLVKTGKAGPNEFDAITGATESSRAIERILNSGFKAFFNNKSSSVDPKNLDTMQMSSLLAVLGIPCDAGDSLAVRKTFARRITEGVTNGQTVFRDKESDAAALLLGGGGYQAAIILTVALKGDTISGFRVISQNETPGLGSRIREEGFQNQFIGKKVSNGITLVTSGTAGPGEFAAITRATESSRAIERILNSGFNDYFAIKTASNIPLNQDTIPGNRDTIPDQRVIVAENNDAASKKVNTVPENLDSTATNPESITENSETIPKHDTIKHMADVLTFFGIQFDVQDSLAILRTFAHHIVEKEQEGLILYREKESRVSALYLSGTGFQDSITVMISLADDTIRGFRVINQNESPGMGSRIQEETFQNQFIGKKVAYGITLVTSGKAGSSEFDAITGATESSRAIERILNDGIQAYHNL